MTSIQPITPLRAPVPGSRIRSISKEILAGRCLTCLCHDSGVEARGGEGVQRKRRPVPHQQQRRGGPLHPRAREAQEEEEDVAEADLREDVLEGEVRPLVRL